MNFLQINIHEENIFNIFFKIIWYLKYYIFIFLLLTSFLFLPTAKMKGFSMEPTYSEGSWLFLYPLSGYWYEKYLFYRGQIVVFQDVRRPDKILEVKRIVGLPNEILKIEDDIVSVENQKENTSEVFLIDSKLGRRDNGVDMQMALGAEDFFLMGDNRPGSRDSRQIGPIQIPEMKAIVLFSLHEVAPRGVINSQK
jgi:signal peptidase I